MKTTTPGSIGGMNVAIACPNIWLNGSKFRNRSGKKGRAVFPVLHYFALDRNDVGQNVAMRDDDPLRVGGGAGREDNLGQVISRHVARLLARGLCRPRTSIPGPERSRRRFHEFRQPPDQDSWVERGKPYLIADDDRTGVDNTHHPLDEIRRGSVVERNDHHTFEHTAPKSHHPFGTVLSPEQDRVILAQARGAE